MEKLKVKTYSPTTSMKEIQLSQACGRVLVKNFGSFSIWVGVTADSTTTDGMIQIAKETAQIVSAAASGSGRRQSIDRLYLIGAAAETNTVEIQELGW